MRPNPAQDDQSSTEGSEYTPGSSGEEEINIDDHVSDSHLSDLGKGSQVKGRTALQSVEGAGRTKKGKKQQAREAVQAVRCIEAPKTVVDEQERHTGKKRQIPESGSNDKPEKQSVNSDCCLNQIHS